MHRRPLVRLFLALALTLTSNVLACAPLGERLARTYDIVVPTIRPEPAYEDLFPHYVELCAVTQFRRRDGVWGGIPGHAVMYIKGVCRDPGAPYPRLAPCKSETTDIYDESHGVGVSVNKLFKNVNWVGIPGKRLFLDGDLAPDEDLTAQHYRAMLDEVVEREIFRGIDVHERYLGEKEPDHTMPEFIAEASIGTDWALRFARTIYCARLPLTEIQAHKLMGYLNAMNVRYFEGEEDYHWNGYHDNCVHLLVNSLAAAGVWDPVSVQVTKFRQAFNLAVPSNEVINLATLANLRSLEKPKRIWRNDQQREGLLEYDWLPMRHGALWKVMPIHQDNEIFDTKVRIMVLNRMFGRTASKRANEMVTDARFTELEANLRWWRRRYGAILEEDAGSPPSDPDEYEVFERRYYDYIALQHAETDRMLKELGELRRLKGGS